VVGVPGTEFRAVAFAVEAGQTIASVDQYDAGGGRVSHDTSFR
jgi:hypothetical protein